METVDNVSSRGARDLPAEAGYALAVRELLLLPSLTGARLLAGPRGLDQQITHVNVVEVPDILPWVKANQLLLTTGFPFRPGPGGAAQAEVLAELVEGMAVRGAAALGVKSGRYIDELPPAVLEVADDHDFPLIWMPSHVTFDEVMSEVFTQLLDRHARALDNVDKLHRAMTAIVLSGGDLPQIASEFTSLLDVAVLICTADGRVQTIAGGTPSVEALKTLQLFDASGRFYVERLRIGTQPAQSSRGELAVAKIVAGDADLGRMVAYSESGCLSPDIVPALERAATVAALAITKRLAVSAVESKFRGDYLHAALTGTAGPAEQVVEHCARLGWDIARPVAVVVAELDEPTGAASSLGSPSPQDRLAAAWQQVMRARDPAAPVAGYGHEVVILVPATAATATSTVADLLTVVKGDRGGGRRLFSTGVSRVVESVADLPQAYYQARRAVIVGRRTQGPGAVAHFDTLGVHRLLSLVSDSAELHAFASEVLGMLAHDDSEAEDLRQTLQVLLDANCNVAETARALHFHYNTLRYRIGKLESLLGPFTTDASLRLDIALALRVLQMRGL
ncbi:MAG TPA: PucR family transcriptional regulator ligand-binding domain-containing protein [Streptosporangiaceae bacterium]|nr:PucR family transcriptional regulator ligand-binding domain-containing protein [Streptosporangiaceae bacterium]